MADEYLHGAYGNVSAEAAPSEKVQCAIVYIGTAPVNTVAGSAGNVNVPVAVSNMGEARRVFGYSSNWADYTLCEAMYVHLSMNKVGPIVLINVLDPAVHKADEKGQISRTPEKGRITIAGAGNIILDSIKITTKDGQPKNLNEHYIVSYNSDKETITIAEFFVGSLGTEELDIAYESVDPSKVTDDDVVGYTDGLGLNTGLSAIKDVYQLTGYIPSFIAAPGFSSSMTVHEAMEENSRKINKHWDAFMFADLPLLDVEQDSVQITLDAIKNYKDSHYYTYENEKVFFPLALGTDGRHYHLSVLAAANFQKLLMSQDGIPYKSSSNTDCPIIENIYLGEAYAGRVFSDELINEKLCKNGIASAAYVSGRWAIWGAHCADYDQEKGDWVNVAETNRMMLYYVSNDFQRRRGLDVDKPLTPNDLQTIVKEEQTRLDALLNIGALTYGEVYRDTSTMTKTDIANGDHIFAFIISATPLAKSLTANVKLTDDGYSIYFGDTE